MFPLGSPVLPTLTSGLQVFEPRYVLLLERVLAGDGRFGIVLITHGHEVGGGDLRSDVGTLVEVDEHEALDDGRHVLVVRGLERIRVAAWHPDDPHPVAEVVAWPDEPPGPDWDPAAATARIRAAVDAVVDVLADGDPSVRARLAQRTRLPDDVTDAAWLAAAMVGLGPLDQQALLGAPGPVVRTEVLVDLLAQRRDVLAFTRG
jgi:Lon protease-like protein